MVRVITKGQLLWLGLDAATSSPEVLHVQIHSLYPRPSVCGEEPNHITGNPIFAEHRGSTRVNLEKTPNTQV
jgi:hypothetical protein